MMEGLQPFLRGQHNRAQLALQLPPYLQALSALRGSTTACWVARCRRPRLLRRGLQSQK